MRVKEVPFFNLKDSSERGNAAGFGSPLPKLFIPGIAIKGIKARMGEGSRRLESSESGGSTKEDVELHLLAVWIFVFLTFFLLLLCLCCFGVLCILFFNMLGNGGSKK